MLATNYAAHVVLAAEVIYVSNKFAAYMSFSG